MIFSAQLWAFAGYALSALTMLSTLTPSASAHQGAPYPMLRDAPANACKLSAWIDPDEGLGDLFFTLKCPPEVGGAEAPLSPIKVRVRDAAATGPWTGEFTTAERATDGAPDSYVLQVPFSHTGPWDVEVLVASGDDTAPPSHHIVRVEVEAPGPPRWQGAFYASPFVLVAGLWGMSLIARRRNRRITEATG